MESWIKKEFFHYAPKFISGARSMHLGLSDYEVGRWFKLLMEKFPDKYPDLKAVAESFGYKDHTTVSRLISHYEFLEKVKEKLPPNAVPRGTMLPEGFIREVRRAPEEISVKS